MKKKRDEIEPRRIERLLARVGRRVPTPPEHELRAMARIAAEHPRGPLPGVAPRRLWRPFHLRWGLAVAAALLVGSGFGFGLGSRDTSDGSAGTNLVGFGFLSGKGWTVVQSGTVGPTSGARAIAANVPLHPDDDVRHRPYATLRSLPADGILILATFTTRGDPAQDVEFAERTVPLQISGAAPVSASSDPLPFARRLARYRLRAAVGGYNVDVRLYFGAVPASEESIAAAQRQLSRLLVASERVTIAARPSIETGDGRPLTVFGSVENAGAGEAVDIQAKDCRQQFFRGVAGATTREGGAWSTTMPPSGITTTLRAVWKDTASAPITVRARPRVELRPPPRGAERRFRVIVVAKAQFWRKRVLIQRFDRRLGVWTSVKSVVLTETGGGGAYVATEAKFRATLPKRTLIRAVFPRSQARPCYLAGYSNLLRT
jgi:hypothetical protein